MGKCDGISQVMKKSVSTFQPNSLALAKFVVTSVMNVTVKGEHQRALPPKVKFLL